MQARCSVISLAARARCLRQSNSENNIVSAGQDWGEAARGVPRGGQGLAIPRGQTRGREKAKFTRLRSAASPRVASANDARIVCAKRG